MQFYCFLHGSWYDKTKPASEVYREIIEQAEFAEELGYDGVWLGEQNLVTFLATPAPLQLVSIIAERTKRIRLGVAVFVLPFHHPLRLAGEVAQIDVLTGGRFNVGVGRGASQYQARQFQREMSEGASQRFFREHLDIMIRHWSEAEVEHGYEGEFFQYPGATVMPPTIQRPHPPIWVASVAPQTTRWAVELGMDTNHLMSAFREPFSHVEQGYEAFLTGLQTVERSREAAKFGVSRQTFVADSLMEAREALEWMLKVHRVHTQQIVTKQEIVKGGVYDTSKAAAPQEMSLDEMFNNTLMGTPEVVREKVRGYDKLGIDMLIAWQQFGMPHDRVLHSMELFAREVMPEFRDK